MLINEENQKESYFYLQQLKLLIFYFCADSFYYDKKKLIFCLFFKSKIETEHIKDTKFFNLFLILKYIFLFAFKKQVLNVGIKIHDIQKQKKFQTSFRAFQSNKSIIPNL